MSFLLGCENFQQNYKDFAHIIDKDSKIGLLAHAASVNSKFRHTASILQEIYKDRFTALFGPQHGFVCNVQDNMCETTNFIHPFYKVPVFSLYGETRIPTNDMLSTIDILFIDLVDVGTRVYTYISTLFLIMQKLDQINSNIELIILDRPNPISADIVEGNVLNKEFSSFVGLAEIPMRHGMTIGEIALFYQKYYFNKTKVRIIPMQNYKRSSFFSDLNLPWINPSPNLSTPESALTFCGTVLFEGTNISEGRGTTRALECLGFPNISPYKFISFFYKYWQKDLQDNLQDFKNSFVLRAISFIPTFQKHAHKNCGGVFIHPTNKTLFKSWRLGQMLMQSWQVFLEDQKYKFEWNKKPYEYKFNGYAIDYINGDGGCHSLREWCNNRGKYSQLLEIEQGQIQEQGKSNFEIFMQKRNEIMIQNYLK